MSVVPLLYDPLFSYADAQSYGCEYVSGVSEF